MVASNYRKELLWGTAAAVLACGAGIFVVYTTTNADSSSSVNFRRAHGSTMVFSTLVEAPSSSPSFAPTLAPSLMPSSTPSISPSGAPSSTPSLTPSTEPTMSPSEMPSDTPSDVPSQTPSDLPSDSPSSAPSGAPSMDPTISLMPSLPPTDLPSLSATSQPAYAPAPVTPIGDGPFRLKMHWQEGYFWQEEEEEKQYCMACTSCDRNNISEFSREEAGCRESPDCNRDDLLWIQECNPGFGAEFRAEPFFDGTMIRVSGTTNCVTHTASRYITLQRCSEDNSRQKWTTISVDGPFELRPIYDKTDHCITQHHHPKSYEVVGLKPCEEANQDDTGEWVVHELDE